MYKRQGQYQDTGAKMIHLAPHTSSTIVAKSISRGGGRSAYRGLVKIVKGAYGSYNSTVCDEMCIRDSFCTVNLDTGETKFAATADEHDQNVAELRKWQAENQ